MLRAVKFTRILNSLAEGSVETFCFYCVSLLCFLTSIYNTGVHVHCSSHSSRLSPMGTHSRQNVGGRKASAWLFIGPRLFERVLNAGYPWGIKLKALVATIEPSQRRPVHGLPVHGLPLPSYTVATCACRIPLDSAPPLKSCAPSIIVVVLEVKRISLCY